MSFSVRVLFDTPQAEIASILTDRLSRCVSASLVSGFATVEGIEAIAPPIETNPVRLKHLVVGAGTYRAYEAFDRLIGAGVPQDRFHVHLGHTRQTGSSARHPFYRYHPMLHSKVYLLDLGDNTASAFVGSHNLTGFALLGLNGEAGVLLEGPANAPEIASVRRHVTEAIAQSVPYTPGMKEAYSWWTNQLMEGLRDKFNDQPREGESQRTIVILAVRADNPLPKTDDIIYFEIPAAIGRIQSLSAEVHIYIFDTRPPTPWEALNNLGNARTSLWCQTLGLEDEQGGVELRADWYIDSKANPELRRAPRPFRPASSPGMQQVRVKVRYEVFDKYEYLFHTLKASWEPVLDTESQVAGFPLIHELQAKLNLIPPEDREWYLVRGLRSAEKPSSQAYRDLSPEAGSFILLSLRRRKVR
jgi:hypothetical protein